MYVCVYVCILSTEGGFFGAAGEEALSLRSQLQDAEKLKEEREQEAINSKRRCLELDAGMYVALYVDVFCVDDGCGTDYLLSSSSSSSSSFASSDLKTLRVHMEQMEDEIVRLKADKTAAKQVGR